MNGFGSNRNWVMKIIFINISVFLLTQILNTDPNNIMPFNMPIGDNILETSTSKINYYFGLIPWVVLTKYYVWQFVTYMFLHGGFMHIFFNMYGLMLFGAPIEHLWGTKRFLIYYFFTGIGAGITIFVVNYIMGDAGMFIPTIGASGAIFGLLLAFGILFPNVELLIFFVLPIKAKYLVFIYGAIEFAAQVSSGGNSGISHLGHLGGLLFGLIFFAISKKRGIEFSAKKMKAKMDKEIKYRERILNGDSEKTPNRLSVILEKLKKGGANAVNDDEYQFIKLTDILHADESNMCIPEDFNNNDEHCRKCELLESCLMREIKKYL
ncbi:MAG: rhomboid family intramembrane serine protease [Spirochaetes bacterium]|nr:rhomboid family intramembrane serine protease [Spirochaetota bacterium]